MKLAWVENGKIRDIAGGDPAALFHPDVAAFYDTEVPDDVAPGYIYDPDTDSWLAPPKPEPGPAPEPEPISLTPVQFKLLFTSAERVAIRAAADPSDATYDPVVADFLDIINDPQLQVVELGDKFTTDALNYLEGQGFIAQGRVAEILAGP